MNVSWPGRSPYGSRGRQLEAVSLPHNSGVLLSYFDISAKTTITGIDASAEITSRLAHALRSIGAEVSIPAPDTLQFKVPLIKTLTRGYAIKGVSRGEFKIQGATSSSWVLSYRLETAPMRWFCVVFVILAIFIPWLVAASIGAPREPPTPLLTAIPGALVSALAYFAGRMFVRLKFRVFVSSTGLAAS